MSDSPDSLFDLRVEIRALTTAALNATDALQVNLLNRARREIEEIVERAKKIEVQALRALKP